MDWVVNGDKIIVDHHFGSYILSISNFDTRYSVCEYILMPHAQLLSISRPSWRVSRPVRYYLHPSNSPSPQREHC